MKLVFKFSGGPMDGKTVIGHQGKQDEADRYYALSDHGRVTQRFRVASPYAIGILTRERPHHFQQCIYEVTQCLEDERKVFVRAEYVRREA